MITINVSKDYTKTPGGRLRKEGPYSGEDFRESILKPKYIKAKKRNERLVVNLDGGYGYGISFLEEAFGGLARELHDWGLLNIEIISEEEPEQVENIYTYIRDALELGE